VGLRAGLDRCGKPRPQRDFFFSQTCRLFNTYILYYIIRYLNGGIQENIFTSFQSSFGAFRESRLWIIVAVCYGDGVCGICRDAF
jgi:hypothetical protein